MLSLRIALRYLLSRKSHGAVNVISAISLAAIAVAAAAMVIVLSVFNGFSQLAESKLSALDPDFTLTPAEGKSFQAADSLAAAIMEADDVASVCPEITEQAFAVADGHQMPVTLKGMTCTGVNASGLDRITIDGVPGFPADSAAEISVGVAMSLNLRPGGINSFTVYEPRRAGRINPANPMAAFRSAGLTATGVFQVEQEEYDRDVIIVPFSVASGLLGYADGEATSLSVYLKPDADAAGVRRKLDQLALTRGLIVKNRFQQQEHAFRMIAVEKWITFVMLAFILVIASCNIISTLSMLILEKEENMGILKAIGATHRMINRIFISQEWMIVVAGGSAGILLGTALVLCQQHFGWIRLGATDMALLSVDSYPVALEMSDILATFLTLLGVALLITPVIPLIRRHR